MQMLISTKIEIYYICFAIILISYLNIFTLSICLNFMINKIKINNK